MHDRIWQFVRELHCDVNFVDEVVVVKMLSMHRSIISYFIVFGHTLQRSIK